MKLACLTLAGGWLTRFVERMSHGLALLSPQLLIIVNVHVLPVPFMPEYYLLQLSY